MGHKPTILMLVLATVAVALAMYVDRNELGTPRAASTLQPLVTEAQLPIDAVNRITLKRQGEDALVFERQGLNWLQIEPFEFPMDSYSMRQLAATAHQVQVVQRLSHDDLDEALTAQAIGLDPPAAEIRYEWEAGSLDMELGRRGIAGRAYMRMQSDEVLVVRQNLHERVVEMDPREWRDRTIFHQVGPETDRIVRSDGLVLERERRSWLMRAPVATRADNELVEQYVQALAGARSGGFIADRPRELHRFGVQPSAADIAVFSTRDASEQRLHIGMPVGAGTQDRYGMVAGRPTVMRIPAAVLQAFFRQPQTLIDPTGSGVHSADVRSIRIDSSAGEILLERDLERWRATEHDNIEVPAQYVEELLAQLTQLRAGSVSIQPYPLEMQAAVVTFFGFRGQPLDTVRIVRDPNSGAWALENGDDVLRVFTSGFTPRLTAEDFGIASLPGT